MTRVSIVTISFNQREFLERTILSVLAQDFPQIEYIVVDPGSTDGSRDIIQKYQSQLAKIIFRSDRGPADGLNNGFAEATGDVFGFVNSDDVLLPGAVSSAVRFLERNQSIDVVSGHSNLIDADDRVLRHLYSDKMSVTRFLYGASILIQPSTFFRRPIFDHVGGFCVENKAGWDGELFLDMACAGAKFAVVNEFWSSYRVHLQSVTGSKRTARLVDENRLAMFVRAKGREPGKYDRALSFGYRLLRHIMNPQDTWERIHRGPVYGRAMDQGSS
jgi:glycosyltransferase involved in cell wall biosynthesis